MNNSFISVFRKLVFALAIVTVSSFIQAQNAAEIIYVDRVETYTMPAGEFFIGVFICLAIFVIMVLAIRKLVIYQTKNEWNSQTERVRKMLFGD